MVFLRLKSGQIEMSPMLAHVITLSIPVQKTTIHSILFGGDQLTAARARVVKRIKTSGNTPQACFTPCAED